MYPNLNQLAKITIQIGHIINPENMEDFWLIVFAHLEAPIDFRSLGLTCKTAFSKLQRFEKKLRNCRHLERLLRLYPHKDWDYDNLSYNSNFGWDMIQKNLDKIKLKYFILKNPNVKWDNIKQTSDGSWILVVSQHEYMHLSEYTWSPLYLSQNPNITWQIVKDNPTFPWNYRMLCGNPNITWNIIEENPDKFDAYDWISQNPNMSWDIVQQNPHLPWNYRWLSQHPNIGWDIISNNPTKFNDYCFISANPNITWEIVQQNPHLPWDYLWLSQHPNITWDIIQQNKDKFIYYHYISQNPNLTWEIVKDNPEFPWCWRGLSLNTFGK